MLGYLVDPTDPRSASSCRLTRRTREPAQTDGRRAARARLFTIDESVLDARGEPGKAIGRPHLAQAVVSHPDNADAARARGADGPDGVPGRLPDRRAAGVPRRVCGPSVGEAIELIHGAGGVAIWAHPFWDVASPAEVLSTLDRFVGFGLDGVEAFYVTHTRAQTELLVDRCSRARPADHRLIRLPRPRTTASSSSSAHSRPTGSRDRQPRSAVIRAARAETPDRVYAATAREARCWPTFRLTRCSALSTVLQSQPSRRPTSS